jgi:hypothetical protein
MPHIVATSLKSARGPEIDYLDLDLSQSAIDNLEVTTGPLCKEGEKIIVEALLSRYAPQSTMKESRFTGTIR